MDNWQLPDINQRVHDISAIRKFAGADSAAHLPRISCLTATYNRLTALKRAIQCYCAQTYPNKELVIVSEGSDRYRNAISRHVQLLDRTDIKVVFLTDKTYTLGEVRNISIESATGDIICQWDDDDQYHPHRLEAQVHYMMAQEADVCYMTDQLHFFSQENVVVWEDWTYGGQTTGEWQLIPGTLMMYKDMQYQYPTSGEEAIRGEDSVLLQSIYHDKRIARLSGAGPLYLYTCHGRNTFSNAHHEGQRNTSFPLHFVRAQQRYLKEHLCSYHLHRPCTMTTPEGHAFTL